MISFMSIETVEASNLREYQANEVNKTDDNQFVVVRSKVSFHTVEYTKLVVNRTEYPKYEDHCHFESALRNNRHHKKHRRLYNALE